MTITGAGRPKTAPPFVVDIFLYIMPLDLLPGAKADLAVLRNADPKVFATVVAFLEEADADDELIDKFTDHGDVTIGRYLANVKPWVLARQSADNLFRIRVLNTPATVYRVVYGFDWHTRRIGILAVVHKDQFDYGLSSEIAIRIQSDWDCATGGRRT